MQTTEQTETGVAFRCSCCGTKKAAQILPRQSLTIVFGKSAKKKHRAVREPLEVFKLPSGGGD